MRAMGFRGPGLDHGRACRRSSASAPVRAVTVTVTAGFAWLALTLAATTTAHAGGDPCSPHWDQTPGQPGFNGWVYGLKTVDLGNGEEVLAGGLFTEAGGVEANGIARWDGNAWSPMGDGVNDRVFAMELFDDGNGPALYIAGNFTMTGNRPIGYIARWDPTSETWNDVGGGVNDTIITMIIHDDGSGPALYAGGRFTIAGGQPASSIARWDGKEWSEVGGGVNDIVRAMVSFDDGAGDGAVLYIGGLFSTADGAHGFNRAARWDGRSWSPLGLGLTGQGIRAMAVYDDGRGPSVYAGGLFDTADGRKVNNIARWDHHAGAWFNVGQGTNERVVGMHVFDDGGGEQLYLGGWFTMMDGQPVNRIARWDGQVWTQPGGGANMVVRALTVAQSLDLSGPSLYAGGGFTQVEGKPATSVALWVGCDGSSSPADLNGDGAVNVLDLLIVLSTWGDCDDPVACSADLNADGAVNVLDLLMLLGEWS